MGEFGPENSKGKLADDVIRDALRAEFVPGPIDTALKAIEGNRTTIVTDANGVAREVTFVAPDFPDTYEE